MLLDIILGLVRHLLTAGAVGVWLHGHATADESSQIVGAILTLLSVGWSIWHKKQVAGLTAQPSAQTGATDPLAKVFTSNVQYLVKVLVVGISMTLAARCEAQDTNTTLLSGNIPLSTNHTASLTQRLFGQAGVADLGGGYTAKFNNGIKGAASFSVIANIPQVHGTVSNALSTTYSFDWNIGAVYTYVPAWDEHEAGIGGELDLFHLPQMIGNAQAAVKMADAITPRLEVAKMFGAAEVKLNDLTSNPEFRLTGGISFPF